MTERKTPGARRGRPPKGMTPAEVEMSRAPVETPREDKNKPVRAKRIGMQQRKKLDYIYQDSKYYYRWMQDRDGRIQHAREAGYEFVTDENGQEIQRRSGPYSLHLMRLPIQYRIEDEKAKQAKVIETIKHESKLKEDEYIPDGQKHVVQKNGDFDPFL